MKYYIVTGRIDGDDEDSISIVQAPSADDAEQQYIKLHRDPDVQNFPTYINYVIECDSEPRIVRWAPL